MNFLSKAERHSRNQRLAAAESMVAVFNRAQAVIEFALGGVILSANDNFLNALAQDASELTRLISRFSVAGAETRSAPARRPTAPPPRMSRPQARPQTRGSAALKLAPQARDDTWEEF